MGLIQKLRTSKRFGLFKPNYETKNLFLAQMEGKILAIFFGEIWNDSWI
jgi:hypothetical protein